jgi:type IV secretory pathway VirB6-like protein
MSCVHNFNDYANMVGNTTKVLETNNTMIQKLSINQSNAMVTKSSKQYNLYYELLDQRFFFYFTKLISASKRAMQNFYRYKSEYIALTQTLLKVFFLNQKQLKHNISSLEAQKKIKLHKRFTRSFLSMSPKLITEFAKSQICETGIVNLKKNNFTKNLQGNLVNIVKYLLLEFKYDILGLKIICSGK